MTDNFYPIQSMISHQGCIKAGNKWGFWFFFSTCSSMDSLPLRCQESPKYHLQDGIAWLYICILDFSQFLVDIYKWLFDISIWWLHRHLKLEDAKLQSSSSNLIDIICQTYSSFLISINNSILPVIQEISLEVIV